MKKTFTEEEFKKLTSEVVDEAMKKAEEKGLSPTARFAMTLSYVASMVELKNKLFDDNTSTIEITTEKEF